MELPAQKLLKFERGLEPGSSNYETQESFNNIRFIRVGDMEDLDGSTFISKTIADKTAELEDILMSFDASIGRVSFGISGAFSTGIRRVSSIKNDILNGFIYYYLTSTKVQNTLIENAIGTTIKHASKAIDHMTIPYSENTTEIAKSLESIFRKQLSIKIENRRLIKLRDTLLPELLNGNIDVSNIDI